MNQGDLWHVEQERDFVSLAGDGIEKELYPSGKKGIWSISEGEAESGTYTTPSRLGEPWISHLTGFITGAFGNHERTYAERTSLLLTNGREEAVELLFEELLKPGETVLTETPVSPVVLAALLRRQVKVIQAGCDAEGMLSDEWRSRIAMHKPVLIYITPDCSDTVGSSWSVERRREIVEIAGQADIWLLSDRSSAEAPFAAEPVELGREECSLYEIGRDQGFGGRIAELVSLDGHGIQAGWIRANEALIQRLKEAREGRGSAEGISCPAGASAQMLVRPGFSWPEHAAALNREYAARRAEALAVLAGSRALGAACQHAAGRGRFLWAELPTGMDSAALLRAARLKGAAFLPGARCYAGAGNPRTLRLSLAEQSRPRLRLGLQRICDAAEEFTARWEG
ncbi:hypothetical protein [Paenibacillus sp. YPG26]|uniref:hypothetical protein n=1 Tax=Paenibacillus sp. YPG26 TaxID=2878915 RepID=UPI00203DC408|nr:hypothetical protein [Paenibacillus sp. YPG26]USB32430.1 hypothetical protein LDO05_14130 [Paenibacillus sp. YPG26]